MSLKTEKSSRREIDQKASPSHQLQSSPRQPQSPLTTVESSSRSISLSPVHYFSASSSSSSPHLPPHQHLANASNHPLNQGQPSNKLIPQSNHYPLNTSHPKQLFKSLELNSKSSVSPSISSHGQNKTFKTGLLTIFDWNKSKNTKTSQKNATANTLGRDNKTSSYQISFGKKFMLTDPEPILKKASMVSKPKGNNSCRNSSRIVPKTQNYFEKTNSLKKNNINGNLSPIRDSIRDSIRVSKQIPNKEKKSCNVNKPNSNSTLAPIPPFLDDKGGRMRKVNGNVFRDRLYSSSINLNSFKNHDKLFDRKSTPNPILKKTKASSASRLPQIFNPSSDQPYNETLRVSNNYNLENGRYNYSNNYNNNNYTNNNYTNNDNYSNNYNNSNNNTRRVIFKNLVSVFRFDSDGDSGCSASSEYEKKLKTHSPNTTATMKPPRNSRTLPALFNPDTDPNISAKDQHFYQAPNLINLNNNNNNNINYNNSKNNNIITFNNNEISSDYGNNHLYIDDDADDDNEKESGLSTSPDHGSHVVFHYSQPFEHSNPDLNNNSDFNLNINSTPNLNSNFSNNHQESNQILYFGDDPDDVPINDETAFSSNPTITFPQNLTPTIITSLQPFSIEPLLYPPDPTSNQSPPLYNANISSPLLNSPLKTSDSPPYGYDVSIDLPQADYDLLKQQEETASKLQHHKQQQQLTRPQKQHRYPHLPYSLYLREVQNQQEITANIKKNEKAKRQRSEATFKYSPLLGSNNVLMITVRLGVALQPNDVLVKANKNGSKLRIVKNQQSSLLPEDLNEQILLPIQINPYKIAAKIDTSGNLLIEAPISRI